MTNRMNEKFACYDKQPDRYVPATKAYEPLESHGLFPKTKTLRDEFDRECDRHIEELSCWLRNHPARADWKPGQWQAYDDRITSLAGWLKRRQINSR